MKHCFRQKTSSENFVSQEVPHTMYYSDFQETPTL